MPIAPPLRRRPLPFLAALALIVALLLIPAPGSLSVVATRWLASAGSGIAHVEVVSELGLMLLAAATIAAGLLAWFRHPERRARLGASAVGVVAAYAASEVAKFLFAQPRPCTRWPSQTECPPAGDWSLPSNHAALAFGAAVVIAVAVERAWLSWAVVALATLLAVGRVAQGVHYVHDVALGAAFGLVIPAAFAAAAVALRRARTREHERRDARDAPLP
ncbi:phosphatase PAP2 family protein [Leifsonia sp. NPDC058292]|uniref:phosphatase PAP2 family protein n=1 Tax=Leifsonia sp. NPDC058292 TaxID=3346428 RepID=UPI0036D8EE68